MKGPASAIPARVRRRTRRGSLYALVLTTVAVVTGFVLVGTDVLRAQRRAARAAEDALEARVLALSALDIGIDLVNRGTAWRGTQPDGAWITGLALGSGTLSLAALDPVDGRIATGTRDPLVLTGEGRVGAARQRLSVTLTPGGTPHDSLAYGVFTGGAITVTNGAVIGSAPVFSNGSVTASGAMISADVSAVGSIGGSTYTGTTRAAQAAVAAPSAALVSEYAALGTRIPYTALASGVLQGVVLGPDVNPFGAGDPRGVYVLDCGGSPLTVRDVRIVGTLVILDPGTGSRIAGGLLAEPGADNFPVLVVRGSIELALSGGNLSEAALGVNLNPAGLPIDGVSNATATDTFASSIRGLIYATTDVTVSGSLTMTGAVSCGGALRVTGTLSVARDAANSVNPPPGFQARAVMRVVDGSWRVVTD